MKVICVKYGDKYGAEWVLRLQRMVQKNLPIPHEFVCMTEHPVPGVSCIPLLSDLPGWWSKLALFKPGAMEGDKLYLDLDVVITDSLVPIVALLKESPGLWARDDFSYSMKSPRPYLDPDFLRLLGGPGTVNSSVMLWRGDVVRQIWDRFTPDVMKIMHGDQNWISHVLRREGLMFIPEHLVSSYKYHAMRGEKVGNVCVFHGDPKPPALPVADPLRVLWEAA